MTANGNSRVQQIENRPNGRLLFLDERSTRIIFLYYFFLLILFFLTSCSIFFESKIFFFDNLELSIIGACASACMGSTIFYIRKLYKTILNDLLVTEKQGNSLKIFATFIYFFTRPTFSMAFALLVVIGAKSGAIAVTGENSNVSQSFVYACMFISFFAGFLSGRFIKKLEVLGEGVVNKISRGWGEDDK